MLVIRFFRIGKKNQPSFKIVVTDKKRPTRAGRFLEEVGFWSPLTKEKVLKKERILHWLSVGAKPSASLHNLLVSEKIIEGKKIPKHKKPKEKPKEEKPAPEKPTEKALEEKKGVGREAEKPLKEEKTKENTSKKT